MAISFTITFFVYPVRSLLVSDITKNERVYQRAKIAFLEEDIFNTVDRTGILIFISHLEHKVVVIGDAGINEKVKQEDWQNVVNLILTGIKQGEITNGIVKAIGECKELLLHHGFKARKDNTNELSDDLRIG
jgi:putative membrane protein